MKLDVFLHELHVGEIVREPESGVVSVVLDEAYVADLRRPVLGQQFEDRREHRVFRQAAHPGKLPTFFANLLPEGALHAIVATPGGDDAATLERLGGDLPGAVVVRPASSERPPMPPKGEDTFDESALGPGEQLAHELRFSLAGVQLKFSASEAGHGRWVLPFSGNGGRFILKFASPAYPGLPENEYATMRWAAASGLAVPRIELVPEGHIDGIDARFRALGPMVFVIERYDRFGARGRIHQEDFAQVRGILPEQKYQGASYEGLARFVADTCRPDDLLEYVRRLVFVLLSGNTDAHLKNWSLTYADGRSARLAPAYDFVFVRRYLPSDKLALPIAKERDPMRVEWAHFQRVERFLRERGHVAPVVDVARAFAAEALARYDELGELPPGHREALDSYLAALPLARR